jgi:hypothetical protein
MGVVFWDKFTDNTDIKGNYLAQNVGHGGGEMSQSNTVTYMSERVKVKAESNNPASGPFFSPSLPKLWMAIWMALCLHCQHLRRHSVVLQANQLFLVLFYCKIEKYRLLKRHPGILHPSLLIPLKQVRLLQERTIQHFCG